MSDISRRDMVALLGAAALTPLARSGWRGPARPPPGPGFRIRTITAGITLHSPADMEGPEAALDFLQRAKRAVADAGYEVRPSASRRRRSWRGQAPASARMR